MSLFETTHHINIQISNLCNYSIIHKNCPVSKEKNKQILPSKIVYNILDTLEKYNYGENQSIAFYLYNDSLNDPRLFNFLQYAKEKTPKATIIVGTNGWYLNEVMAKELYEAGCTYLLVSSYSDAEHKRLLKVKEFVTNNLDSSYLNRVSFTIRRVKNLDSRLDMNGQRGSCYAPLTEVLICPNGKLRLCCLDVNEKEGYGDLNINSFEEVMQQNYKRLFSLRSELIKGERNLELCKTCNFRNRMKGLYLCKGDMRPKTAKLNRR